MLGEKLLHVVPHFFGEHVAGFGFDEGRKILRHPGIGVGLGDGLDACAGFLDGRASVSFAEVQVERARRNEAGDVRLPCSWMPGMKFGKQCSRLVRWMLA